MKANRGNLLVELDSWTWPGPLSLHHQLRWPQVVEVSTQCFAWKLDTTYSSPLRLRAACLGACTVELSISLTSLYWPVLKSKKYSKVVSLLTPISVVDTGLKWWYKAKSDARGKLCQQSNKKVCIAAPYKISSKITSKRRTKLEKIKEKIHRIQILRRQGGPGPKNMLILFERFHRCGVNAFYGMSKFCSVQKLSAFQCVGPLTFL